MVLKPRLTATELIAGLQDRAVPENRAGMARFGIEIERAMGVSMPNIRALARLTARSTSTAQELWDSGMHEARILAALVADPANFDRMMADQWVADFNSWDLCDQVCGNLFDRTIWSQQAIMDWQADEREFVRRAAFATIAWRAVHLKREKDETFLSYLPLIEMRANDNRNFVRKSVNWALRQIGKRNPSLHASALELARRLSASSDRTAAWIGKDAVRELTNARTVEKLRRKP